jgi:hypothetical protein
VIGLSGIGLSGIGLSGIGLSGIGLSGIGLSGIGLSGIGLSGNRPTSSGRSVPSRISSVSRVVLRTVKWHLVGPIRRGCGPAG